MILTVTLNPALDVTYRVPRLEPGTVHRVTEVVRRPGGKGVNVAAVVASRGVEVTALLVADAPFAEAVAGLGPTTDLVPALTHVRQTLVVHADETTSLWEPGSPVPEGTGEVVLQHLENHLPRTRVVVVSGSLAPGLPADLPSRIARRAQAAGAATVLDLDGAALALAVEAGGSVLVPNEDELARLTGVTDIADPVRAVRDLSSRTGAPVLHTRGEHGMLVVAEGRAWQVRAPRVDGNPTGAGDATAAGFAVATAQGAPWPGRLRTAAAMGAAAVAAPTAGTIDESTLEAVLPAVEITEIP